MAFLEFSVSYGQPINAQNNPTMSGHSQGKKVDFSDFTTKCGRLVDS